MLNAPNFTILKVFIVCFVQSKVNTAADIIENKFENDGIEYLTLFLKDSKNEEMYVSSFVWIITLRFYVRTSCDSVLY